jgi:dihydroorotate dehydrogenase
MYSLFRPLLFRLDPETAHGLTLHALQLSGSIELVNWMLSLYFKAPSKPVEVFGLKFKNPVGLAAGYDKDGIAVPGLASLGFGHLEIGTVTPLPQPGNPKPRIFRLVEDQAVINRMGFPGQGAEAVMKSLRKYTQRPGVNLVTGKPATLTARRPGSIILGINLGKNKQTPNEEAVFDYLALLQNFARTADYLAINISSPNTVGLRRLQGREALEGLLTQLAHQRRLEQEKLLKRLPLLVKLAPDLSDPELDDALDGIVRTGMDGVIVTNTTLGREGLRSDKRDETGGLSGDPLRARSEAMLAKVVKKLDGRLPIVSVGGIMRPEDAKRRLEMGAALVQVYTGLVYAGPGLVKKIIRAI